LIVLGIAISLDISGVLVHFCVNLRLVFFILASGCNLKDAQI
jgi:hypothetical protein